MALSNLKIRQASQAVSLRASEKKKIGEHDLNFFLKPGLWMSEGEIHTLMSHLKHVVHLSGKNFDFGLLDPRRSSTQIREFLSQCNLCVVIEKGEAIAFCYNMILREKPVPVIHAGLVVIGRNTGADLLNLPYIHLLVMQYRLYGKHFMTNVSSTPAIIGSFSDRLSRVWPNYKTDACRPPSKQYLGVVSILYQDYVKKFFPNDELELDRRRFVIRSSAKEMGFETNPRKLSRYSKMQANLFCSYWLDYSKGEDIVQVGQVNARVYLKFLFFLGALKIRGLWKKWAARTRRESASDLPESALNCLSE